MGRSCNKHRPQGTLKIDRKLLLTEELSGSILSIRFFSESIVAPPPDDLARAVVGDFLKKLRNGLRQPQRPLFFS
jgi:hypothetical protein